MTEPKPAKIRITFQAPAFTEIHIRVRIAAQPTPQPTRLVALRRAA